MRKNLKFVGEHPIAALINCISFISGLITIVAAFLLYTGRFPGYKRIRLDSVIPTIQLNPGQTIRLNPQFPDGTTSEAVESVTWNLRLEGSSVPFTTTGYQPTIILPTNGGIFTLEALAMIRGEERLRKGQTSIYILQDEGKSAKFDQEITVPIDKHIQPKQTVELLTPGNVWLGTSVVRSNAFPKTTGIVIPAGKELKMLDGKLIFRTEGASNDLSTYGAVIAPKQN